MHFGAKQFFLVSFILLLLVGIPVSVYFLQQQQTITQQAAPSTNFSFEPVSSSSNPLSKTVGESIPLDVIVNPGSNAVSSVTIEIQYDPEKLEAGADAFKQNEAIFPTVLADPVYTSGKITVVVGVSSPDRAIQTKTKVATVTFTAKAKTSEGVPTQVTYTANNIATSNASNDQALENVLSGTLPAYIMINDTETPTSAPTAVPTLGPTAEPEPTSGPAPVCSVFTADATSGNAPMNVNFTTSGSDPDGSITKITFNFGDGQVSDVTSGGGIGSSSATASLSHTYTEGGSFQASAIFTDNTSGVSGGNCSQTISVTGTATPSPTATPTIAPAGSAEVIFGVGAVSLLLIIGGALIFLIL